MKETIVVLKNTTFGLLNNHQTENVQLTCASVVNTHAHRHVHTRVFLSRWGLSIDSYFFF